MSITGNVVCQEGVDARTWQRRTLNPVNPRIALIEHASLDGAHERPRVNQREADEVLGNGFHKLASANDYGM
jgi:hypothetical protein